MELMGKKGFTQTEVGLIPEDWNLVPFDRIFTFFSTSNYSKAQMSEEDEVGCIHYGLIHAISNTKYDLKDGIKFYVTVEQAKYEIVRDGDVIMVDASEDLEGINKSVEVFGVGNKKYISGLHTYLLRDKESILAEKFRGIVLNSKMVKDQMLSLAVGMKVFGVSKTQLVKIKLPLPPTIEEQKAIATALNNVDELITNLDKLISKKKNIKKGVMQQLLTPPNKGGKRLPGFSEDWKEKRLGDISSMSSGGTPLTHVSEYYNGNINWVSISDMTLSGKYMSNTLRKITNKGLQNSSARLFPVKTILLAMYASIGKCCIATDVVSTSQAILGITTSERLNEEFLYYFLYFNREKIANQGQQGTQSNLNKSMVEDVKLWIPKIQEQNAVVEVLADIDKEIQKLVEKKQKGSMLKQGMMQELLTGKTRLI